MMRVTQLSDEGNWQDSNEDDEGNWTKIVGSYELNLNYPHVTCCYTQYKSLTKAKAQDSYSVFNPLLLSIK
jgi:hypothetical protein